MRSLIPHEAWNRQAIKSSFIEMASFWFQKFNWKQRELFVNDLS